MIITTPREWPRILDDLRAVDARRVFVFGCGQCATVAGTGGEEAVSEAKRHLEDEGFEVTGTTIGEVACHVLSTKRDRRRYADAVEGADAVLVLSCGAGVQTVADVLPATPVFPGLESAFLGNVIRHGVFEERCQMCGECVLDVTGGICPVTTCPKGLLNGPCGGMWEGRCEVLADRECTFVRIHRRLDEQHRSVHGGILDPKDHSKKRKPGSVDLRSAGGRSAKEDRGRSPKRDRGEKGGSR